MALRHGPVRLAGKCGRVVRLGGEGNETRKTMYSIAKVSKEKSAQVKSEVLEGRHIRFTGVKQHLMRLTWVIPSSTGKGIDQHRKIPSIWTDGTA
jgi:hypothetical protein